MAEKKPARRRCVVCRRYLKNAQRGTACRKCNQEVADALNESLPFKMFKGA